MEVKNTGITKTYLHRNDLQFRLTSCSWTSKGARWYTYIINAWDIRVSMGCISYKLLNEVPFCNIQTPQDWKLVLSNLFTHFLMIIPYENQIYITNEQMNEMKESLVALFTTWSLKGRFNTVLLFMNITKSSRKPLRTFGNWWASTLSMATIRIWLHSSRSGHAFGSYGISLLISHWFHRRTATCMELHAREKIGNKWMWKCMEWMEESGERNGLDKY